MSDTQATKPKNSTSKDEKNTETVSPQILGADFKADEDGFDSITEAYNKAISDAETEYNRACREADDALSTARGPRRTATRAMQTQLASLFGSQYDTRSEAVMSVTIAFLQPLLDEESETSRKAHNEAYETQQAANAAAKETYDQAVSESGDPFVTYLRTVVAKNYPGHVRDIIAQFPCTITELNALADRQDWCTDYEQQLGYAFKRGYLTDTKQITRRLDHYDVPAEHNAKSGEAWEATITLPGCYRDSKLRRADSYYLRERALEITYRRLSEAPIAADNNANDPF